MANVSVFIKMEIFNQKNSLKMQSWMVNAFGIFKMERYRVKVNMKMETECMFFMIFKELNFLSAKWKMEDVFLEREFYIIKMDLFRIDGNTKKEGEFEIK